MPVKTVDDTGLSPSQITSLKQNGITTVGRYLSHSTWKALSLGEVANLKAAGMQIFSVYESNPTKASYFSAVKGKSDALDAINLAKAIGQPENTAIYFTVDYDAQSNDLNNILAYFQAIKANLHNFKIGIYGGYTVLNFLHEHNVADYWFQTVAWSYGQKCSFLNIYQSQCDTKFAGISVDIDELLTSDVGAWGQPKPAPQPTPAPIKHEAIAPAKPITPPSSPKQIKQIGIVTISEHTVIRSGADASYPIVKAVEKGEGFKTYDLVRGWYNIGAGWVSDNYCTFKKI